MRLKYVLTSVLVLLVAYLLFWPVDVDPVAWTPPGDPGLTGDFESNERLRGAKRLLSGVGTGPEDVVADTEGNVLTGLLDGRILRFSEAHPDSVSVLAETRRPLGMELDGEGNLVFADAYRGLMRLDLTATSEPELLAGEAGGKDFAFANDVAVTNDGTVYFTDSSYRYGVDEFKKIMLSHAGTGRLLRYDPARSSTSVVREDLQFPNGLTLSNDGEALLMVETGRYRVLRFPLGKDGTVGDPEVFVDALPGVPDNINSGGEDGYWLAMPSPRNRMLDAMAPYPFLRSVVARLPSFLHPAAERHPIVVKLTEEGSVARNLQDATGDVALVSSAYPHNGDLYLGSYAEPVLRRWPLEDR